MLKRLQSVRFLPTRFLLLFSVLGPGIITANADNDASGIYGYSLAGAQYRYEMLWVLVLSTFALGVAQEICARMGAVTGRGLADLIREEYGPKITLFAMTALFVANFATTVSEFAGILAAVQIFVPHTIARLIILPLVGIGVYYVTMRGTYRKLEKFLLGASTIYLLYIASAFMAHPHWIPVLKETFLPSFKEITPLKAYIFMVINVIGTTITPWGQFYIQSTVRDKGVKAHEFKMLRADVLFGAFFTNFIAFFIIVCCGTLLFPHHDFKDAGVVAQALGPLAGGLATVFFAIGLLNASCFGAIVVPLSTAYAFTESLGWESGVGRQVKEAPLFVGIFTFLLVTSVLIVMFFPSNLAYLIILPNIVGGVLLPIILVLMLMLVNKRRLMGEFVNSPAYNAIAWATTIIIAILSIVLLVANLLPG